ncbi:hypothetical protein DAPPUDRAFT_316131 [Daphnia pulex]|uniref:Uncharacterized protein n=1 Tax=Daphnia pulex TaxID=6669 RepID=E9GBT7_DAPPU|nr:hypothetical protein DAPPUDRAFT_316131 [Daphnia pulex]|eukprot:EFX83018.1 hypothetical protein DAPPUDRAFT_316131 [Daphnia pulex]
MDSSTPFKIFHITKFDDHSSNQLNEGKDGEYSKLMTGTAVTCLVLLLVICIFLPYCYHKCACRNAGRADGPSPLLPKAPRPSLYFLSAPVLVFHENDMEGFWNSECNIEFEQSPVEFIPEPVQVAIAETCPSYHEALELNNPPPTYEECQCKEIFAAVPEVIRISTDVTEGFSMDTPTPT